jgi:hypothetical protein
MFLEPGRSTPRFPTAIFQARAIDLPPPTRSGPTVDLLVHGQLTIRGERRDTEVHMQARPRDGRIEVVGSTRFALDRYGITAPDFGGFVRVDDQVTVEFHLLLRRQG